MIKTNNITIETTNAPGTVINVEPVDKDKEFEINVECPNWNEMYAYINVEQAKRLITFLNEHITRFEEK